MRNSVGAPIRTSDSAGSHVLCEPTQPLFPHLKRTGILAFPIPCNYSASEPMCRSSIVTTSALSHHRKSTELRALDRILVHANSSSTAADRENVSLALSSQRTVSLTLARLNLN